jgi:hypothetical protein
MEMWCFRQNQQPFSFVHGNNSDIDAVGGRGGGGTIERKFFRQGKFLHYQHFLISTVILRCIRRFDNHYLLDYHFGQDLVIINAFYQHSQANGNANHILACCGMDAGALLSREKTLATKT